MLSVLPMWRGFPFCHLMEVARGVTPILSMGVVQVAHPQAEPHQGGTSQAREGKGHEGVERRREGKALRGEPKQMGRRLRVAD